MLSRSVSLLSADEVRCRLAEIRVERARLDAEEASLVGRLSELSCERSSSVVPEFEMTQFAGLRGREASRVVQRSAMLDVLPDFGSALASGSIVAGHVDVVADSLKKVSDADRETVLGQAEGLLRSARRLSVDQFAKHMRSEVARLSSDKGVGVFERQRRATYLKFWNDVDGMMHLRGAFDPERGSILLSRLEQRVEAMFHTGDVEVPVEVGPGVEPATRQHCASVAVLPAGGVLSPLDSMTPVTALLIEQCGGVTQSSRFETPARRLNRRAGCGSSARRRLQEAYRQRCGCRQCGPDAVDESKLTTPRTNADVGWEGVVCDPGVSGEVRALRTASHRVLGERWPNRPGQSGAIVFTASPCGSRRRLDTPTRPQHPRTHDRAGSALQLTR